MHDHRVSRRGFLRAALGSPAVKAPSPHIDATGYTPTRRFFREQLRPVAPLDSAAWTLSIGGQVEHPLSFTYADLLALPTVELPATLACMGLGPRNALIGHARWRGVLLSELAQRSGVQAAYAQFVAADGYHTYTDMATLNGGLLAFEMNGAALTHEHGSPARIIIPGLYGYKMPKWVTRIDFTDTPSGVWENRGWSVEGTVQPSALFFTPRHQEAVSERVQLSGMAYAGLRAITHIEVSVDDGDWMPVPFTPASPGSWTPWQIDWQPPAPGEYLLRVRANDDQQTSATPHAIIVRFPG